MSNALRLVGRFFYNSFMAFCHIYLWVFAAAVIVKVLITIGVHTFYALLAAIALCMGAHKTYKQYSHNFVGIFTKEYWAGVKQTINMNKDDYKVS